MIYNILNGDALASGFPDTKIPGEIVVVREALIEGDLSGDNLAAFWKTRARSIGITIEEYYNDVVKEFDRLTLASDNSVFNLWFEYDLFCQVNMWFVISFINNLPVRNKVYAVYTNYLNKND